MRTLKEEPAKLSEKELDSYKLGDRVFVNGIRAGKIAYLGETHFAPVSKNSLFLSK